MDLPVVLSMDATSQLDVFRHYEYMLNLYSTQNGIFQEAGQIVFGSFLQCLDFTHLEVQNVCSIWLHYHGPGLWRATYGWGAQYSFATGISPGEPLSWASTSGGSLTPFLNSLWKAFPLLWAWYSQPLYWYLRVLPLPTSQPTSRLGKIPATSLQPPSPQPSSSSPPTLWAKGCTSRGYSSVWPLLWTTLAITFVLTIWNGAATSQRLWWAFQSCTQAFSFLC